MVSIRNLSWLLAATLLAASCTAEVPEKPELDPTPQGGPLTSFGAGFEQEEESGKTWITYDIKYDAGLSRPKVLWSYGDKIKVFASDGDVAEFTLKDGDSTRFAHFDGYLASSATPYFAFYPHLSRYNPRLEDGKIKFTLPQTQYVSTTASGQMPIIAYLPSADANTTFRNVCGMLRIGLTSSASVTLSKIELIALNGEMLWGNASLVANATIDTPNSWVWALNNDDENRNKLILDFLTTNSKTLSSTTVYFYAAVPPGALSGGIRMIFYDESNNPIDEICTGADLTVGRAHVVRITDIEVGEFTLLDLEGSANCYIADRTNTTTTYKFCTFMGNSGNLVPRVPKKVEELWETQNGGSTFNEGNVGYLIDNLNYSGGCISFTVQDRPGNALVAAKNSSDEIMWSWHIWMPYGGDVPSVTLSNGTVCQDRNLGSLYSSSNTEAMGLLYQYGRKDPFTAPFKMTENNITLMVTSPTDGITSTFPEIMNDATIQWTIEHPTIIIDCSNSYWDSGRQVTWRGNAERAKSIYDPCPSGWKVPDKGAFDDLTFLDSWDGRAHRVKVQVQGAAQDYYFTGTGRRYLNNAQTAHNVESGANAYYWTTDDGNSLVGGLSGRYSFTDVATIGTENDIYYLRNTAKKICIAVRCVAE